MIPGEPTAGSLRELLTDEDSMVHRSLTRRFQAGDRTRGDALFAQSAVEIMRDSFSLVEALVEGQSEPEYLVSVERDETSGVYFSCGCHRFLSGRLCKHVWAVIRAIAVGQAGETALAPAASEWRTRLARPAQRPALSGARERQVELYLGIDRESMLEVEPSGVLLEGVEIPKPVSIQLRFLRPEEERQRSLLEPHDGEPARLSITSVTKDDLLSIEPAPLRPLIAGLLSFVAPEYSVYATRKSTLVELPARQWEVFLPALAALGRLGWLVPRDAPSTTFQSTAGSFARSPRSRAIQRSNGMAMGFQPLRWDAGAPWRVHVEMTRRESGGARLRGELVRGDESIAVDQVLLVLQSWDRSAVCVADALAPLDSADTEWVEALRGDEPIEIPEPEVADALEMLHESPALPPLELPEEWRWPEVSGSPAGLLRFDAAPRRGLLHAQAFMLYGESSIAPNNVRDRVVDRLHGQVVIRDRGAEESLLEALEGLGPTRADGIFYEATYQIDARHLDATLERLLAAGWEVELDGSRLERGTDRLGIRSGIDWFDLSATVDFESGSLEVPELLRAVREKRSSVDLGGGRRGFLSADVRRRLAALAALAMSEETDEDGARILRFKPSQALLLDLLLDARQVEVASDERFETLRRRVRDHSAAEPVTEPESFRGALRPYQRLGVGWMRWLGELGLGGCLADDMGLGKTVQVLALLDAHRHEAEAPSLIVVPATLVENWRAEAERFTPELQVGVFHGPGRAALLDRLDEIDLLVTTYATLRRDIQTLADVPWDFAILDEAQAIKNPRSQTAKACRLLRADRRLGLTGTPVENHLGDLWSLFEFLTPGMLGRLPALEKAVGQTALDGETLESIARALRPLILRRTKSEVLDDLPPKIEQTLICELSRPERKRYDELRDHYRAALQQKVDSVGLGRSKIMVLEALLRLRQAAIHPGLLQQEPTRAKSAKVSLLLDQLEQVIAEGHKALVFSQFVRLLDILAREIDRRGWRHVRLDGRTRDRAAKVESFQTDPEIPLFLISLKAGGTGLNLTAASYVFLLDPWWNPAIEAQAIDRAHRIGQHAPVTAYRLIARDTVEEKIVELQERKRALADAIVARDTTLMKSLTAEDLELLLG